MAALLAVIGAACTGTLPPARPASSAFRSQQPEPLPIAMQDTASADGDHETATSPPELYVRCEDRSNCPNAVGMLVDADELAREPERCTVSLIAPDRALTASHCLSPAQRHAGAACARTWVLFPETIDAPALTVACARVLFAADVLDESALHQEHAVLQLARAVPRAALVVDAEPPEPGSIVTVVSVTPHPVYGSTHALSARLCQAIDSRPAQDALGAGAANVGWLASCPIARGNSGSPVIDYQGRIRAIVHGGTNLTSAFAVTSAPIN
jgi:hypothetical protein